MRDMEEKDILNVLKIVTKRLTGKGIVWRMEGSANLLMQGIDVEVNDIDITTGNTKRSSEFLKEFVVKSFYNKEIKAESCICKIKDNEVEINCYDNKNLNMFEKIKMIKWHDLSIPILPLIQAKEFYELIGRKEKVDLIIRYLDK